MRKDFGVKPWFYPLPVLIVGTYGEDGRPDAMNAAWGGLYGANMVELCLSEGHKTTRNIRAKGAFTVSFADAAHAAACDYVGLVSGNSVPDKMEKSGLTVEKSRFVDAPVIRELPLVLECRLARFTEEGNVLGEIVNISADESILGEDGEIDLGKFHPIAFEPVHNGYHVLGEKVADAFVVGNTLK